MSQTQIKGMPLIKFKSSEIINSLKSGKIYLNSLKWFRDYENDNGDMIIGDSYEGMLHINDGELVIKGLKEKIALNNTLLRTVSSNSYVFCMSCIYPKSVPFKYSELQKKDFQEFGDTALVILDSNEFIKRIKMVAEKEGYEVHFNKVRYYDAQSDVADVWFSLLGGTYNIAFWKRLEYQHQQEFRIVITDNEQNKDHIELNIGDISDISKVYTAKQILDAEIIPIK